MGQFISTHEENDESVLLRKSEAKPTLLAFLPFFHSSAGLSSLRIETIENSAFSILPRNICFGNSDFHNNCLLAPGCLSESYVPPLAPRTSIARPGITY